MNKVLNVAAVVAFAASASQASPFWELAEDGGFVTKKGLSGVWFKYDDAKEDTEKDGKGGCTSTDFPEAHPTCEDDMVSTPWKAKKAITYTRVAGCNYSYPFAGIGFTFVTATFDDDLSCHTDGDGVTTYPPQEQAPDKIPADARDGGGIKVYYKLEGDGEFTIELSTGDGPGVIPNSGVTAFNEYAKALPKGDYLENGKVFLFADFNQENGWGTKVSLETALAAASGFKFKGGMRDSYITGTLPVTATLEIKALEWVSDEDGTPATPTIKTSNGALVGMTQVGRVLSFTGISPNSTVEVINLHGALVAREAMGSVSNPSINLSSLPSGVYMVKVKGASQNFTQKVLLLK